MDPDARFPEHPALACGDDGHVSPRIGMTDGKRWQPAVDKTPHTIPKDAAVLAAPRKRALRAPATPGNASTPPLRVAPHDSGPMWVANSHSHHFDIHHTSPV